MRKTELIPLLEEMKDKGFKKVKWFHEGKYCGEYGISLMLYKLKNERYYFKRSNGETHSIAYIDDIYAMDPIEDKIEKSFDVEEFFNIITKGGKNDD